MSVNQTSFKPTPELTDLLVRSGSQHRETSLAANAEFAKALEQPLRQGVLSGNILISSRDGDISCIQTLSKTSSLPTLYLTKLILTLRIPFV